MFAFMRNAAIAAAAVAALATSLPAQAFVHGAYHVMPTPSYMAKLVKRGHPPPARCSITAARCSRASRSST